MNRRNSSRSRDARATGSFFRPSIAMERRDRLLEAVALDEPHGVERPAGGVVAQAVDRDDAGMLELAGDLGLLDEPGAAVRFVGVAVLDLLERDRAVELLVQRDRDLAQPALGMRAEDAKSTADRSVDSPRLGWVTVRYGSSSGRAAETWARLAWRSASAIRARSSRTEPIELRCCRLFSGSSPWNFSRCSGDEGRSSKCRLGVQGTRSRRIWPSGTARSCTQRLKASSRASRSMKLFWRASRPKSRLRSAGRHMGWLA